MSERRLRARHVLIVAAAGALHLVLLHGVWAGWAARLANDGSHRLGRAEDFFCFYQAGTNALAGESVFRDRPDLVAVPWHGAGGFRYLPLFAYTVGAALNALPPWPSYWAWTALTEVLLLVNVALTWVAGRARPPGARAGATAMWLVFSPYAIELHMGQSSFAQASLIFWTGLALARGRMALFDATWVASVLFKMNTFLLVPLWLRLGRARAVLVAAGVAGATSLAYFAFFPADAAEFAAFNFADSFMGTLHAGNLGLQAWMRALAVGFGGLGFRPDLARASALVPTLGIVGGALWVTWRAPAQNAQDLFGMWIALYFALYKDVWEHHYVMLLPVLVLFCLRGAGPWIAPIFALVALPTPFALVDAGAAGDPEAFWNRYVSLLYHSSKALPSLALAGWLAARALGRPAVARDLKALGAGLAALLVALLFLAGPGFHRQGLSTSLQLVERARAQLGAGDIAGAGVTYRKALDVTPGSPHAIAFFEARGRAVGR